MKMTYFVNKWANKAIEEYKQNGDLASLIDEHFMLSFDKGSEMIEEIEKVEFAAKYNDLEEEEIQEMLIGKVQEKIDVLMNSMEVEAAPAVEEVKESKATAKLKEIIAKNKEAQAEESNEQYVFNQMKNETIETLTKRGRGVQLEQWCLWIGVSEYGTAQEKAERLLKWYQDKETPEVEGEVVETYERGSYKADVIHNPFATKPYKVIANDSTSDKTFYRDTLQEIQEMLKIFGYHKIEEVFISEGPHDKGRVIKQSQPVQRALRK